MGKLCQGRVKIPKKLQEELGRPDDSCFAYGNHICEDCGKLFCHSHINRNKHKCDDSVKGCHSIWKDTQLK